MRKDSWNALRNKTHERAKGICEYCWTDENNVGLEMHVDHVDPQGETTLANLALSCPRCNLAKGAATTAKDPETGSPVLLFNPRIDNWSVHFAWSEDYTRIVGTTDRGRATIARLRMNDSRTVVARKRWRSSGNHPPLAHADQGISPIPEISDSSFEP